MSSPGERPEAALLREAAARLRLAPNSSPAPWAANGRLADELREAVCAYARAMRERGDRAEQVVVQVRAIVHEALGRPEPDVLHEAHGAHALVGRAVTWCIKEYYRME